MVLREYEVNTTKDNYIKLVIWESQGAVVWKWWNQSGISLSGLQKQKKNHTPLRLNSCSLETCTMCIIWGSLAKYWFSSIHYPCENLWRINLSFIYLHEQNQKLMPLSRPEIAVSQTSPVAAWDSSVRVLPSSYPVLISKSNLCD